MQEGGGIRVGGICEGPLAWAVVSPPASWILISVSEPSQGSAGNDEATSSRVYSLSTQLPASAVGRPWAAH